MARIVGIFADDWPEPAESADSARSAVASELYRLCGRVDSLSVEAYSLALPGYLERWKRTGATVPKRGLRFDGCEAKIANLCAETRARIEAALGKNAPDAASRFIDAVESVSFTSEHEMREACTEALSDAGRELDH